MVLKEDVMDETVLVILTAHRAVKRVEYAQIVDRQKLL
jgi:UDP-N-acetyl-D-mannosaminuronate dehydrogenase